MSGTTPVLELQGLTKRFGGLCAVSDVDLSIAFGERHGILGPNGAGKTTLFNLICGVYPPTLGKVLLNGCDVSAAPIHERVRAGIGRTFQITNLFQEMTVLENVMLATGMVTGESRAFLRDKSALTNSLARAREHLDALGLRDLQDWRVRELGYGQQRQVELVMALALQPKVLLLDEPTAGLSPVETKSMAGFIKSLPDFQTILMIEHDLDVIFDVVDEMTVMHRGEVICEGDCDHVGRSPVVAEVYIGG
ncbi:MAG: ABC transporter ATP-binding protein [Thermoleophilia bacterium]